MGLGRATTVFAASVALTMAGGSLVFQGALGSPGPAPVLAGARRFASGRSLAFTATVTVTSPAAGGATLTRHLSVHGSRAADGDADWVTHEGQVFVEQRTVRGVSGLWARAATSTTGLDAARWVHAPDEKALEAAVAAEAGSPTDQGSVLVKALVDRVASAAPFTALLAASAHPRRVGGDAHLLSFSDPPAVLAGPGDAPVGSITGQLMTDGADRPQRMAVGVISGPTEIGVVYTSRWDRPVRVSAPTADAVVAQL